MKVSMMLADHAQAVGGKLFICGGGWSVTGPGPVPFAIVIDIKVPWHGINQEHTFSLNLLDADGNPVEVDTDQGLQPMMMNGTFRVSPNHDARPGEPIDSHLAVNFPPQPIADGGRYEWRLSIDNVTHEDWYLAFSTRQAAKVA